MRLLHKILAVVITSSYNFAGDPAIIKIQVDQLQYEIPGRR